ncbi:unnamed protein product [Lepeophtheirus salmonis]|uniref:(salmon louse) hypothetical protein n=1 Tax=Lepeophtheirus salmonis TaxID=72036 RepID=A0A7R8D171_LEPSM|nr:unnamed protein product [Lepeophtheirus salmonis]CAF2992953.1 unnamed protein product [Lepeophtheirus salmonis]
MNDNQLKMKVALFLLALSILVVNGASKVKLCNYNGKNYRRGQTALMLPFCCTKMVCSSNGYFSYPTYGKGKKCGCCIDPFNKNNFISDGQYGRLKGCLRYFCSHGRHVLTTHFKR